MTPTQLTRAVEALLRLTAHLTHAPWCPALAWAQGPPDLAPFQRVTCLCGRAETLDLLTTLERPHATADAPVISPDATFVSP